MKQLTDRLEEARKQLREYRRFDQAAPEQPQQAKPRLETFEHELIELLLMQPDLALPAVDALTVNDLETTAAKEIFKMYEQLVRQNVTADLSQLLLAFDDPDMKNLLADCDHTGQSKQDTDVEWDLQAIIHAIHQRQIENKLKQDQASLESDELSDEEQLNKLEQFFKTKRESIE